MKRSSSASSPQTASPRTLVAQLSKRGRVAGLGIVGALLGVSVGIALASACGASVSAVYEGDVRFERCMALDWAPQVDPQLRRGCWEEWEKYFTAGQTRDRMEYAKLQLEKLRSSQVMADPKPLLAVPEPTNVFAPPPMMLADAGAATDGGVVVVADVGPEPKSECESNCDERTDECRALCRGPVCEKACAAKRSRCLPRCR